MSDQTKNTPPESGAPPTPATSPVAPAGADATPAKAPTAGKTKRTAVRQAAPPTHYQIVHSAVGPHRAGEIVEAKVFDGVDVQRLLDLGAIAAAEAPSEEADEE